MTVAAAPRCEERWLGVAPGLDLYVREYGDETGRTPVVCLHGYWRTSRDFEELAEHLARDRRVITADLRGRGRSGRSEDPENYRFDRLLADVVRLLDETRTAKAVFVGLALGAQLSMALAALSRERVAGLVLNDSGPESNPAAGHRMKGFSGGDAIDRVEALRRVRAQYEADFPRLRDEQFERLVYRNYAQNDEGLYVRDFDQLTNKELVRMRTDKPDFWAEYRATAGLPTVVLRGENSDYLTQDILDRMRDANPEARVCTLAECGHPVMLWEPEALAAIDALLDQIDGANAAHGQ